MELISVTSEYQESFEAFQKERGRQVYAEVAEHGYSSPKAYASDMYEFMVEAYGTGETPLVTDPTPEQRVKLNPGARVLVGVPRVRNSPRMIVAKDVLHRPYCYYTTSGKGDGEVFPDSPMIRYFSDAPGAELTAAGDGLNSINSAHVIAIYDYGTPVKISPNRLYRMAQSSAKSDRAHAPKRRARELFLYDCPNFMQTQSTTRGKFKGDILSLTKLILSRRPELNVAWDVDRDKIKARYIHDGMPGFVSMFTDPWNVLRSERVRKATPYQFDAEVLKNYRHFVPTEKELVARRIEDCRQMERDDYAQYQKDMERDNAYY